MATAAGFATVPRADRVQLGLGLLLVVATGIGPDLLGSRYWGHSFQLVNVIVAAAVFQNLLMHDANQVSFGQGAVFGAGAYLAAMGVAMAGLPWPAAFGLAGMGAAGIGLLFALPALRVQGYYLGFVTLSAATVFPELLFALDRWTNGINGISVPVAAWRQDLAFGVTPLSLAAVAVACSALLAHVLVRNSAPGRVVRVAGASAEAAQTLGIRPGLVRAAVFVGTAFGTGLAGALYAPIIGFVTPAAFHLELSILLFLAVIVGGRGQVLGPLTGIYLLYLLPNVLLASLVDYRLLAYGVLALVVMLAMPDGLIGTVRAWFAGPGGGDAAGLDLGHVAPGPPPSASAGAGPAAAAIAVAGATKAFGAVRALDAVDLDVPRGSIVGIVGGNGSGKTTLLNAITGFVRLSEGTVEIAGRGTRGLSPAGIARLGVGRTFQTPRIFEVLSAWENVAVGRENRLRPGEADALADADALRRCLAGLDTATVPHGQRRSLEVLRVLLTAADTLLLDEPAAGLSAEERAALSGLLLRLRDRWGRTILLVEHDLDLVWRIADRVAVMEGGRIVACGPPRQIAEDAAVRKLFVGVNHA